ncbi:MAG: hypothetical protein V3W04_10510 [Gammaproteobacteria bacterium]
MILKFSIDDQSCEIDVPDELMREAQDFYASMDADMDKGWQMSRSWVEKPDLYQRCQIVSDRVLGAFHSENKKLMLMMAGYILSRAPDIREVAVDTTGDITMTELVV